MLNKPTIKLAITDIPLCALKLGSCTLVTFPVPPSPDPVYIFTFYKGIKLEITDMPLSAIKVGIMAGIGHVANNSIKLEMSDLPDMSNLKIGIIPIGSANMCERIYFRNFRIGYQ